MPFGLSIVSLQWIDVVGLFVLLAGYVLGLGAVTVIDLHGFLGRKSSYWTEATTRTHKVTKPLIWAGIILVCIGGVLFYRDWTGIPRLQSMIALALILNGCFLSFSVSPYLLEREKKGRSGELLPAKWQQRITVSFLISFFGWWSSLLLLVVYLLQSRS